jgi:N-carbamoyl-L-amino-acid hydrolase
VSAAAGSLGLRVVKDAALNLWMTLPGRDANAPAIVLGSHLDSVPQGGNFDGLAGVLAGLACVAGLREDGIELPVDVTVVALRGEENAWFGAQHVGSRAALGLLKGEVLDAARRVDSGKTLAQHMHLAGADVDAIRSERALVDKRRHAAFLELHIEQGPILADAAQPVGIVTGIRGNVRCREAWWRGEAGHSGVVPRAMRRDAVMAAAEFVSAFERFWDECETAGDDLVVTFGQLSTNPATHGITIIPGEVKFCFEARSHSPAVLDRVALTFSTTSRDIGQRRRVVLEASELTRDAPISMDRALQDRLAAGCRYLGLVPTAVASGAGHDAGDFALAGVPAGMIFVRSRNGSHNPAEAMEFSDFIEGVRVMDWVVRSFHGNDSAYRASPLATDTKTLE